MGSAASPLAGTFAPSSGFHLVDFGGSNEPLDKTITLTSERTVLASYQIPATITYYLACHLYVTTDGGSSVEKVTARSITGTASNTGQYVTNSGQWWGNLAVGTHQFQVKCRTEQGGVSGPYGVTQGAGYDFQGHSLQIPSVRLLRRSGRWTSGESLRVCGL